MLAKLWLEFDAGLIIMLVGMGVVFTFLMILVWAMGIMSKIVLKLNEIFPEKLSEPTASTKSKNTKDDEAIAIAIAVATKARM